MSNYAKITDFSAKDALTSGDPERIILGSDVDAELTAIATAITSKYDAATTTITLTGNFQAANITATSALAGAGSAITALNATNLASGTVADARLSANIPLLNAANAFTASLNTFASPMAVKGSTTGAALLSYLRFTDSGNAENAFIGFGNGASSILALANEVSGAELRLTTAGGGAITLNGINVTDYPRLSQNNSFAGTQSISLTGDTFGAWNTTSANGGYWTFRTSSVDIGYLGANKAIHGGTGSNSNLELYSAGTLILTTAGGTFSFGSGLVSTTNASASEVGYKGLPQNSQSIDYTAVLGDADKTLHQTGASKTFTIPANGSVAYPVGTVLNFTTDNATGVSIAITTDTLRLAGTATTGTRTLAQYGVATAVKILSTTWLISGAGLS